MPARADYGKKTTTAAELLAQVRKFSERHDRWPTVGEIEVALDVHRRVVQDKLRMLRQVGEAELDTDGTITPADDLPPAGPVTTYRMSRAEIELRYGPVRRKGVGA
jgi:hypothetical protein